jgi:hypothetical protein
VSLAGSTLELVQPKRLRRVYHLRRGEEVVGALRWEGLWRPVIHLEADGVGWTLRRDGMWRPRYVVESDADGSIVATFEARRSSGAGTVTVHGETLEWVRVGPRGRWGLRTPDGAVLVDFRGRRSRLEVTVAPEAGQEDALPLLVLLGCFLMILQAEAAAASGAAAATA